MDGELFADRAFCEKVAEKLSQLQPEAIFTMWPFEKSDHAAAYSIAHKAMDLAELRWTCEFYMSCESEAYRFQPDMYVNVEAVMDEVHALHNVYPSQWNEKSVQAHIDAKQHYGKQAWCNFAEGFKLALPQTNERWNRKTEVGRILMDI